VHGSSVWKELWEIKVISVPFESNSIGSCINIALFCNLFVFGLYITIWGHEVYIKELCNFIIWQFYNCKAVAVALTVEIDPIEGTDILSRPYMGLRIMNISRPRGW
jgi:hypothetical protein